MIWVHLSRHCSAYPVYSLYVSLSVVSHGGVAAPFRWHQLPCISGPEAMAESLQHGVTRAVFEVVQSGLPYCRRSSPSVGLMQQTGAVVCHYRAVSLLPHVSIIRHLSSASYKFQSCDHRHY